jgi:PAS domain S-box-containing protein
LQDLGREKRMPSTKQWRVFYTAVSFGLIVGIVIYLALYLSGGMILMKPGIGIPVAALVGILLGFTYYLFFKFVLRAFTIPFLDRAQALVTRPIDPLAPPWESSELDKIEEVSLEALATLERLDLFSSIAREIVSSLEVQKTLQRIVSTAVETLPADSGFVFLLDKSSQRYTIRAHHQLPVTPQQLGQITFAADEGVPGWVTTSGQPLIIGHAHDDDRVHPILREAGVQSLVSLPLVFGEQSLGVLNLFHCQQYDAFDENDLRLASIYADLAAVAIHNARLYRQAEEERVKLAAILADTTDVVVVIDQSDRILLLNSAAEQALGVESQTIEGQPLSAIGVEDLVTALHAARTSPHPVTYEIAAPGERVLYASVSPVRGVGWVMVMQDITPLKELDRLRTEWVAAVSHDLKNPIAAVQMSIGLMEKGGPLTEFQRELLDTTLRSTQRLRSLVTDVLDLARLEAGPAPRPSPVDPRRLVDEAIGELGPLARDKGQDLITVMPADLPPVCGDVSLLTQALANLVSNAVKYTPKQGQITIRTRPAEDALQFEVTDSGRGIPEDALPHLFERFYRVPGSEGAAQGTGLGLSIVKTIVEKHGGRVWAESQEGKGSTFAFTVPLQPKS